jgi:DNA processing protein
MNTPQLLYALALQAVPNIGDITAKKLIRHCGSPEAVFKESKASLLKIEGIGTHSIKNINQSTHLKTAEKELTFMEKNSIQGLYFEDANYPFRLKHCIDGPIVLFQKGTIDWEKRPIISVVGTRKITTYGLSQCEKIIETLAVFNPIIVSGFAYGTDISAHKSALKHHLQTVGCMAQGLQHTYPKSHLKYRNLIENQGGFVTDFWSTAVMDPSNFLKRNRLIAGLSEATIVIESAEKGGSLATATMAFGYNREVFALPGRITDSQSQGCHSLIKTKNAHLVSTPADIPYILNWSLETQKKVVQKKLFVELDSDEKIIYNYLKKESTSSLDVLAIACDMPTSKAAYLLLNLELKGVCRPLPGQEFELV